VDDSILPWWNNRTYTGVFWSGTAQGSVIPNSLLLSQGFATQYAIYNDYFYSYRYYKKLDFLLGMIGGAVFLLYLFFWVPFSYVNRTYQKIKNAEELFITKDQFITTEQNLHKISFPFYFPLHYFITKFCSGNSYNKILEESEK
jgi:uncharacterized membrane protein